MTRVDLPHLWISEKRRGARRYVYAYYRRDGRLLPIRDGAGRGVMPGDPGFLEAYNHTHKTFDRPASERATAGSLAEVIREYLVSPEFRQLATTTQADYRRYLEDLKSRVGSYPASSLTLNAVKRRRDALAADRPVAANRYVAVVKLLYSWAIGDGRWPAVKSNPAIGIRRIKTTGGYRPWTRAEIATFRGGATAPMRLALMIALTTGLRRGDVVRLHRNSYQNGVIEVATSKRGVQVRIPAHRDLRSELDTATPPPATTILVNPEGHPWRADSFGKAFAAEVERVGLPADCHYHGLRKTAGVYLAESGCTAHEIQAVLGCSLVNAEYYCREANRLTLATSAVAKLERHRNGD